MQQAALKTDVAITLQNPGEETTYLTLSLGAQAQEMLSLSLQEARALASALIQHVHRAEVMRNLKRSAMRAA